MRTANPMTPSNDGLGAGRHGRQDAAACDPSVHTPPRVVDDRVTLTQARSMLMLLLAACKQTEVALQAAANALDTDLTNDLSRMIERSERELVALNVKINALPPE